MNKIASRVLILSVLVILVSMVVFKAAYSSSPPIVETGQAQTEDTTVALVGKVQDSGGQIISQYGFKWGTSPDMEDFKTENINPDPEQPFQVTLSNLEEGTTYYYQAYAVNSKGSADGEIKNFTVPVNRAPDVSIANPSDQSTVIRGETVTITATGSDDKEVVSMGLEIDGAAKTEAQGDILTYNWNTNNLKPGNYELKVNASDGKKTTSQVVRLTIKAETPKAVAAVAPAPSKPTAATVAPAPSEPAVVSEPVSRGATSNYNTTNNSKYPKLSKVNGAFGQFHYRETSGGRIEIEPKWVAENIITITLPGLERKVQVHKNAADNFIHAFTLIKNGTAAINGKTVPLLSLIKTMDGTFVPRHVMWDSSRGLSNHSWGTAIDINASTHFCYVNPEKEPNDPNLILWQKAFKPAGFSWGNSYSDAMHFELFK